MVQTVNVMKAIFGTPRLKFVKIVLQSVHLVLQTPLQDVFSALILIICSLEYVTNFALLDIMYQETNAKKMINLSFL